MGDAGEGLIDADSRIQERMEELEREKTRARTHTRTPEELRVREALESLKLARRELESQRAATTHAPRAAQLPTRRHRSPTIGSSRRRPPSLLAQDRWAICSVTRSGCRRGSSTARLAGRFA